MKDIRSIGEFGLIDRIARRTKVGKGVIVGIGDDCAVLRYADKKYLLTTADLLIENVHFRASAPPQKIGHKAIAASISDVAAMGGVPKYAMVCVGLRPGLSIGFVDGLYEGIRRTASEFGVSLVGGDTNASKRLIIDVAVLGEVEKENLTLRSTAKLGDIIFVTGTLGGSIYAKHLNFVPRVKEARYLVKNYKVHSMIDISDGLSSDLRHICESSGAGATIYEEAIPLSKWAKSPQSALNDGEDFELLFTMPLQSARTFLRRKPRWMKVSQIGEITNKKSGMRVVDARGRSRALRAGGFRHF